MRKLIQYWSNLENEPDSFLYGQRVRAMLDAEGIYYNTQHKNNGEIWVFVQETDYPICKIILNKCQ